MDESAATKIRHGNQAFSGTTRCSFKRAGLPGMKVGWLPNFPANFVGFCLLMPAPMGNHCNIPIFLPPMPGECLVTMAPAGIGA